MRPNLHPADDLALLRTEIRRLRDREAALREGFLAGSLPVLGRTHRVDIRTTRQERLLRDRLPAEILCDPALWAIQVVRAVTVTPILAGHAPVPCGRPSVSASGGAGRR